MRTQRPTCHRFLLQMEDAASPQKHRRPRPTTFAPLHNTEDLPPLHNTEDLHLPLPPLHNTEDLPFLQIGKYGRDSIYSFDIISTKTLGERLWGTTSLHSFINTNCRAMKIPTRIARPYKVCALRIPVYSSSPQCRGRPYKVCANMNAHGRNPSATTISPCPST